MMLTFFAHALATLQFTSDTLTLAGAAGLFKSVGKTDNDRDISLQTRLQNLRLSRTRVAPSSIELAGDGLFATRDIDEGELVTMYPGDALAMWSSYDGDRAAGDGAAPKVVFSVRHADTEWAAAWRAQEPMFVARGWEYGVKVSKLRAIIGDPSNIGDAAYLGHMVNDAAMCLRPGTAAQAYTIASEASANVGIDSMSMLGCHHAVIATKPIRAGEELFLSYGAGYWLSKLPEKPKTYTFPDKSTYYGEVADGQIQGAGEFNDGLGNRYIGDFTDGRFHGIGTYFRSDGWAEASRFEAGAAVGVSIGWSPDRTEAYQLVAGEGEAQRQSLSLAAAAKLAEDLGVPVPRAQSPD